MVQSEVDIIKEKLNENGFAVIEDIYTEQEIEELIGFIENADSTKATFRKSKDLFAIRQFLKEIPEISKVVFNERMNRTIDELFGVDYFVIKSIYFDKPEKSNWFVSYHQDLTISVDKKNEEPGYGPWTVKQDQFAVQPPLEILQNIFTVRIHLDDTDEKNGALKIIPGSHLKNIYRPDTIDWAKEAEAICKVPSGGVMIMRPLLLHGSNRIANNKKRRVIHIEFSNRILPDQLNWSEFMGRNNQ